MCYGISDNHRRSAGPTFIFPTATSKFTGSGGAIVGTYRDEPAFARLTEAMKSIGVAVIKPRIVPGAE